MRILKRQWTMPFLAMIFAIAQFGWSANPSPRKARASANSAANAMSSSAAAASTRGQSADLRSGTKISAQLMSTLDARKAKPGEKVVARVTKNVKEHGHTVIHKGDKLVGHVTSVQSAASGSAGSTMAVAFDHLIRGNSTTQLNTVLTSVLSAPNRGQGDMQPMEPVPAPVMAAPSGGGGGGGLLGGVGSTVGSTVGAVGSAAGGVGGTLGAATNSTLGNDSAMNLNTPVRQIHLANQTSADQSTGTNSVLSTKKGDLRLDSGTRMQFRVAASSNSQK